MAHNLTRVLLERLVGEAILEKKDFCYETNFNSTHLYWPKKFKAAGFKIELIYFCLNSIDEAKKRVAIRVENGGHFVPNNEIVSRFLLGYENLNTHYIFFDQVHLFNTSTFNAPPEHIVSIANRQVILQSEIPQFLEELIPDIWTLCHSN